MRAFLVSPDESQRQRFLSAVTGRQNLVFSKILDDYPEPEALSRLVRAWAPEVIFLSMADHDAADAVSCQITKEFPAIQQVALHSSQEPFVFRQILRLRMRELLVSPFEEASVEHALDQVSLHLEAHPAEIGSSKHLFAFVPAKAGVGASTIAANTTWALSRSPDATVLLADFDLHSGVIGFLFDVQHEYSVHDVGTRGQGLDDESWQRLIKKRGKVDLLLSGAPNVREGLSAQKMSHLAEFTRRNYSVINADLADTFDSTSLAVMREANRIFLVTTPELPALRLARLKVLLFRSLELEEKVSLVVNRLPKNSALTVKEIEETVGLPVSMSFPSDYADVTAAARDGKPAVKLASLFEQFAQQITDKKPVKEKRSRFIERFAVVPMRYSFR